MSDSRKVFKSRVDAWYYVLLAVLGGITVHAISRPGSNVSETGAAILIICVLALPVWLLLSTRYIVTADMLAVRAGPFFWNIPRSDIQGLKPSRSPLSSPALSLQRIEITYDDNRRLLVSPEDRAGFAAALGLRLDEEGEAS